MAVLPAKGSQSAINKNRPVFLWKVANWPVVAWGTKQSNLPKDKSSVDIENPGLLGEGEKRTY